MLRTEEFTLNMGPQHPATHGVFRLILHLDGETIVKAEPVLGYLHRGIEKLAESRTYTQVIPYTDRLDYLAAMLNNLGYVQAVEKMIGVEVPERAEYIRVIVSEMSRIASHCIATGAYALDLGGFTGFMYPFREREKLMDMFEMICGSRMTFSYIRVGGVAADLPEEFYPAIKKFLQEFPSCVDEYDGLITGNEIFQARTKGIGILPAEKAVKYSLSGPVLRGSGVKYDLRKARPYGIYDRFDFEVPVGKNGDCFDRYYCRILEMRQSHRIIKQALEQLQELPEGPVMAKVPKVLKPPKGDVYHEIEGAKGILGYYVVSDGTVNPYRVHVRRPSFINLDLIDEMCRGWKIADVVAILGSIDIVLGEVDC
ncbi:NADH-quinone oxidoreductase subunit D [Desulfohalotomaculum tongense]|uniref:NADH-quinone oxidoreductase subunit D n=1 Tax=Desulforadius tongensis TaxID=1216062 RepID=UPI00195D62AB|nr:NADH-quinone oxidoreductase subunit D [Desulforadius tongensis]MBM7854363.1 NADH-quinone oxidoreductase subunit D [Desulforadius tongensis]